MSKIKVGQIYNYFGVRCCVTFIDNAGFDVIFSDGATAIFEHDYEKWKVNLIAEYPSWQEAVNGKEFNGECL